jgi:hypothetical protein
MIELIKAYHASGSDSPYFFLRKLLRFDARPF